MIEGVVIKKIEKFADERGWLAEIFRNDEIKYEPAMAYVSITNPGVARGPHEHKKQSDFFVFVGPGDFALYLWDNRKDSETYEQKQILEAGEKNPVAVLVPPGVVHGYKCISSEPAYSINLPDKLYKGEYKKEDVDEIRWEKDPDSPFKIDWKNKIKTKCPCIKIQLNGFIFQARFYYVVIKTKNNYPYFKEEIFCNLFIENLKICKQLKGFKLFAFSIIYDHINLMIEPNNQFNLSKIIKSLKENVSRDINVVMGYTPKYFNPLVGETPAFRLWVRGLITGFLKRNVVFYYEVKKFDVDIYKQRFIEKFGNNNPYPKFKWQSSFYDHYIRFHNNHLKKEKDWNYHYNYTVYNHLKHGLPDNWKYTSLNYPELIDYFEK